MQACSSGLASRAQDGSLEELISCGSWPNISLLRSFMLEYWHHRLVCPIDCRHIDLVSTQAAVDGFLEEMIIRRELSDNFCFYEPNYDNLDCAAPWARDSLNKHANDKREYIYSR